MHLKFCCRSYDLKERTACDADDAIRTQSGRWCRFKCGFKYGFKCRESKVDSNVDANPALNSTEFDGTHKQKAFLLSFWNENIISFNLNSNLGTPHTAPIVALNGPTGWSSALRPVKSGWTWWQKMALLIERPPSMAAGAGESSGERS